MIGEQLQEPDVLPENVYTMDEIGVMLSLLNSVKFLVGEDDTQAYRGARIKRTMVTVVECISDDGMCLDPMIIWPAKTHRANWTAHPTPGWVCVNNRTRNYLTEKAESSLPFLPILHNNFEAANALLRRPTLLLQH
jgi:hypothetical protein